MRTRNVRSVKHADLKPDPQNANLGTERGSQLLKKSLEDLGAGRSIVVDKNGVTIAGNKTLEQAAEVGLKLVEIETDGTALVVVKRTDLDLLEDEKARQLAIADNRVQELSLNWDTEVLLEQAQDIDLSEFFRQDELDKLLLSLNEGAETQTTVDLSQGVEKTKTALSERPEHVLRWDEFAVMMTDEEAELLSNAAEAWAKTSGSMLGFILHLLRK